MIVTQDRLKDFYEQLERCDSQGDFGKTERFLLDCAARELHAPGAKGVLISIYNELGSFYRKNRYYKQSLEAFENARILTARELGEECGEYATILNNMAGTYRLLKDYQRANDAFLEALSIYRQCGMQNTYSFASVQVNLSRVCQETRQWDQAIEFLEQALDIMETLPEHRQEVAVAYNNLTSLYYAVGDQRQAMFCLNRALQEIEKCPPEERVYYADILNSLAGFLYAQGSCARAIALYQKSKNYIKRYFGENAEYAATCQNMHWVYERLGKPKETMESLEEALRVYAQLLGTDHERTRAVADEVKRLQRKQA